MCPTVRKMAQIVMWVGLVVAGITLVILIFSTTSNNLSLSFNTNLYHFLNLNGTHQSHCPAAKGEELCRKTAAEDPTIDVENIIAPPVASRLSADGNCSKKVATSATWMDGEASEAKATLAEGFSAWWQLQMERKMLIAKVCARCQSLCSDFFIFIESDQVKILRKF